MLDRAAAAFLAFALVTPALAQDDRSDWPESFSVGTASQGGTYFVYGSGWTNMVSELLGLPGNAEVTGGPVQNASLVQTGDLDMAQLTLGPAAEAIAGESALAPGLKHDKLRAIFPMYQTAFHVLVPADSGWKVVSDIPDGTTVGVGPQGGTPGTYWPRMFETLGMDVRIQHGGAADLASQMQDGLIDAYAWAAGMPFPNYSQVEAQMDVDFLGFTPENVEKIVAEHPVSAFEIPAGTYPSMEEADNSVVMWNVAVASSDLPESFVYAVVDAVMTNHDRMMGIHKSAAETLPENVIKNAVVPWHPGAVRWFEENGYEIPDDMKG
ncbi:MAG: TAXI family TRAP transporter solute-binding subunit [Pseudomonadota bacterium]